ncbi:ftsk gamma domain protein [Hoylesella saccharolytica F0055]|uniref:Ftsk gamma domain protein n=3 Tax=Hoylesella TaxID=2974257 RepID=L1MYB0_9BACT|nr:ftsk gamma domain protein [Hoylesella saccharolytica F0055]
MGLFNLFKKKGGSLQSETIVEHSRKIQENINNNEHISKSIDNEKLINSLVDAYAQKEVYEKPDLSIDTNNFDPFFEEAAYAIVTTQVGSTSMIQRRFSIGYNRARRLMDQLEMAGIIGPAEGSKPREVLIQDKNTLQMMLNFRRGLINKDFIIENKHAIKERVLFYQEQKAKEEEWARRELIDAEKERIKQEILEKRRIREIKKQAMAELREEGIIEEARTREPIPQEVQDAVWRRDGGRCVKCGSQENLEFDHIIPFSKGGSNTIRNIQLLCEKCNRSKSNKIG